MLEVELQHDSGHEHVGRVRADPGCVEVDRVQVEDGPVEADLAEDLEPGFMIAFVDDGRLEEDFSTSWTKIYNIGGPQSTMDSVLASHPAVTGENPGIPENFPGKNC